MIALGIDPGASNGAAVVVDTSARRALAVVAWSTPARATKANSERRVVVTTWRVGMDEPASWQQLHPVPGPLSLVVTAVEALRAKGAIVGLDAAAVEAIIVHRATSRRDALALAESAGACAYVAGTLAHVVRRPAASEWRGVVGVPLKPAALCATVARALVGDTTVRVRMPARLGGLPAALAKIDHVADAALIAEWASITSRTAAGRTG